MRLVCNALHLSLATCWAFLSRRQDVASVRGVQDSTRSQLTFSVFLVLDLHSLPIDQPTRELIVMVKSKHDRQYFFAWEKRESENRLRRTPDVALHAKPQEGKVGWRRRSRFLVLRDCDQDIWPCVADGANWAGVPCAPLT